MSSFTACFLDGKYAGQRRVMPDMSPSVFSFEQYGYGVFSTYDYHAIFRHENPLGVFVFYSIETEKSKQDKLIAEALFQSQNIVTIELVGKENYDGDRLCRMAVDVKMPINEFISRLLKEKEEIMEYAHYARPSFR